MKKMLACQLKSKLCMLSNFSCFCCHLLTFFKIILFKKIYQEHYQSVKWFGSRSGLTFASLLIQWYDLIHSTWYSTPLQVTITIMWIHYIYIHPTISIQNKYTEQKWKRYSPIIFILWESIGQKNLLKLNNVAQTFSKRFVKTPPICLVWCMSYAPLSE